MADLSPVFEILPARREQARDIAELIMEAMSHDCCLHFCGPDRTLDDFREMMTELVGRDDSQYSYRNTLVATAGGEVLGCLVGYDGAQLHTLREAFIVCAHRCLNRDFSGMADETDPGEFYIDSLAVARSWRGCGIATSLLRAAMRRACQMGIKNVGLLVDQGNPDAERLYCRVGFSRANRATWGGHGMWHLVASTGVSPTSSSPDKRPQAPESARPACPT